MMCVMLLRINCLGMVRRPWTTGDGQSYSDCQGYFDMGGLCATVPGQLGMVRVTVSIRDTLTWVACARLSQDNWGWSGLQ